MADDLDDEWWLKDKGSADSDKDSDFSSSHENEDDLLGSSRKSKKSKTEKNLSIKYTDQSSDEETEEKNTDKIGEKKKKKKRKTITSELQEKGETTRGSSDVLLTLLEKTFKDKLSAVEWDEIVLDKDNDFYPSSDKDHTPVSYLRTILPKWKKQLKTAVLKPGSPLLLILTPSAIRAVQLNREIQDFKLEKCKCAKLFAKHFKISEQEKYLSKTICHIAIGTPFRVNALLKTGALHLDSLYSVVMDWNWRDVKYKRMTDIPDVRKDLLSLLQTHIIPHVHHSKCKIGIL